MTTRIAPTPLTLGQKINLLLARALVAILGFLGGLRPMPPLPGRIEVHQYGVHPAETLQYIPRKAGAPVRDPVVYVHGGGWIIGKKEMYTRDLLFLAEAGHPVFNLEYPLAPDNPHPGILLSLLRALEWIRRRHPEHLAVHFVGDSAGGNLAQMLGILCANPHLIKNLDEGMGATVPLVCHSVVSIYGVHDRLSWLRDAFPGARLMLECYGGKAAFADEVGPELALTPMDLEFDHFPPSFVLAGTKDALCRSTELCAAFLEEREGIVHEKLYPGEGHGFFNMSWRPAAQELRRDMLAFLAKHDPSHAD